MKTYTFKTSLKCSGCVSALTPFMNELKGVENWNMDLESTQKTLTVNANEHLSESQIIDAVKKAGYTAEKL